MILTHGANSVSVGGGANYILDNFVALYNGVTDSGYAINDGSFGQLLWDANGPIQAPNGQGTPYYARENFSGNNGGVQAIYDGLKSVFSDNNTFTIDFWFYRETGFLDNPYIFGAYNNDRSQYAVAFYQSNSYNTEYYFDRGGYSYLVQMINTNTWYHLAVVVNNTSLTKYLNGHTTGKGSFSSIIMNDINTLRFRFSGNARGIRIAQFALRDYAVWTSDFTPPTLLYKQI